MGKAAVELAVSGKDAVNVEKKLPRDFITEDGFGITQKYREYLRPRIEGKDHPPYKNGLPEYVKIKGVAVKKKLITEFKP
jgi:6-phosphofructokinase 1